MTEWLAYAFVWVVLKFVGLLPGSLARAVGAVVARILLVIAPRLRKTAEFNLQLAFPGWSDAQRQATIRGMTRSLGWMAAEFARMIGSQAIPVHSAALSRESARQNFPASTCVLT